MDRLTVLLAEDHAVVREGTREMLERDPTISVVGEAADGLSAVTMAEELRPAVVLLDLGLPILNGIEAAKRIRALRDPPRILILSAYDDEDYVVAAIDAGVTGYLLKTAHAADVVAALHSVGAGDIVLHPGVARHLIGPAGTRPSSSGRLTDRELQILRLAARGSHTKQIAAFLAVSPRTIEAQFTGIFNKLGVATRTEAIVHAASHGWLVLEREPPLE